MQWRQKKGLARWLIVLAVIAMVAAACSSDDDAGEDDTTTTTTEAATPEQPIELTPIKLQLQWFAQAQFAGYYAAVAEGYYQDVGLDVEILEGGVDIVPQTVLASGGADFALSWVPKALVSREEGAADITDIGQVFQRSGTLQVSFADAGIAAPDDLRGKIVGNWGFGNEFELLAGLRVSGVDPDTEVTLAQQQFDMLALLAGDIDAAQAMTYNEYAQVLETINPDTGELYKAEDLTVLDWNVYGTAMLQDAIWADASRLESDATYRANAVAFLEASFKGWIFCRDNFDECVEHVLAAGPTLGTSHQQWQLNEINRLIWPSAGGIGVMDQLLWEQTIKVATDEAILAGVPTDGAFRTDLAEEALANLQADGFDTTGAGWQALTIELQEGGN